MKSWLKRIGENSLAIFCLTALVAFHAVNYGHGQLLAPIQDWWARLDSCRLALSSSSRDLFSFEFLAVDEPRLEPVKHGQASTARPKLDYANQWLSWTGIHMRALLDQSQQRWINYPYKGKRYYFLRDEIAFQYKRREPAVEKAFVKITRLTDKVVSKAGGTLVIVPMPTKVAIYRDRLPSWLPEQDLWAPIVPYDKTEDPYAVYSAVLRGAPNSTVDAYRVFETYHRAHPGDDLYIPSNHQWSSLGIAVTAAAVIDNLRARGWDLAKPEVVRLPDAGELFDAGMLELLNLPSQFGRFYPQTALHEPNYGLKPVTAVASSGRLFVFGTCYSDRMRGSNGFADVLGRALRRSTVINLSQDGGNTIPAFRKFAKKYAPFKADDLVVWEFIERGTFNGRELRAIQRALKAAQRRR